MLQVLPAGTLPVQYLPDQVGDLFVFVGLYGYIRLSSQPIFNHFFLLLLLENSPAFRLHSILYFL